MKKLDKKETKSFEDRFRTFLDPKYTKEFVGSVTDITVNVLDVIKKYDKVFDTNIDAEGFYRGIFFIEDHDVVLIVRMTESCMNKVLYYK